MDPLQVELADGLYDVFDGPARYRVAYGGRGSTKSWGFARMALVYAYQRKRRILCARELQNSIKESVHHLLQEQIEELKLPGFTVGESFIRHRNGSEFIFKGLRTNPMEIKSMEAVDIAWVEEAQAVSDKSWDILIPTVRLPGSEIWVTFNPDLKTDPSSQRFIENPPPNSKIRKINYDSNPWLSDELRAEMEFMRLNDPVKFKNVWQGEYREAGEGKVVPHWSFANIQEVEYQPTQRLYLSCDFNVDPMCWAIAHIFMVNGQRQYHFFDEIVLENTNIIQAAKEFAKRYRGHRGGIIVTGDASGTSRTDGTPDPNQTRYDLLLKTLSDEGCQNFAPNTVRANPQVESRIEVFNLMVCDQKGQRRVLVDPKCKQIIRNCENLHYIPGSSKIWQPTPKQIELDNRIKFERQDMFDAASYLVNRYDPKIEKTDDRKKPRMADSQYRAVR